MYLRCTSAGAVITCMMRHCSPRRVQYTGAAKHDGAVRITAHVACSPSMPSRCSSRRPIFSCRTASFNHS
eukprot:1777644-Prymnesium_polylepis.1